MKLVSLLLGISLIFNTVVPVQAAPPAQTSCACTATDMLANPSHCGWKNFECCEKVILFLEQD